MSPMVPMKVLGLTLDAENNAPILVLQQDGGSEILPIWIGAAKRWPFPWRSTAPGLIVP